MKMSVRINLDLEPEYEAFVNDWADKLGIPLSEWLCGAWYMRLATATDTTRRFPTTTHLTEGQIGKDWTEEGTGERNVQQHD